MTQALLARIRCIKFTSLLLLLFLSGCSTTNLWIATDSFAEPSRPTHLIVYAVPEKHDLLVEYDELPAHRDKPRRRAYFLMENDEKIRLAKKPRFIKPAETNGLTLVRLQESNAVTNAETGLTNYFVAGTGNYFSLMNRDGSEMTRFDLPTYKTIPVSVKGLMVGPAVVAGHATAVAAVTAVAAAYVYGLSHNASIQDLWPLVEVIKPHKKE
ncbi:MAG TPA: hypothetical protein VGE41_01670 [Verrucomicrobiae bacterium]